jgi:hypothetical protein
LIVAGHSTPIAATDDRRFAAGLARFATYQSLSAEEDYRYMFDLGAGQPLGLRTGQTAEVTLHIRFLRGRRSITFALPRRVSTLACLWQGRLRQAAAVSAA